MADEEPRVFNGRYELHRRIARGGMAEVFLARDSLLDRPVALKILFPEFASDEAFVERFRREAQAAANLSHPNIVSVFDWGEENGTYFIVMEYVEGRTLAQIVSDEGALLPDRAADIAIDVAAALGFAHRNGVVHRDVKPGNVLISPNGQVKVADFGIARAVSTQGDLTQTGTVMGTATYFSPEQARGEHVDPRSDVYSLGVVLYEMLVGHPPFRGDSPVAVAYKHVQEQPVLPSVAHPGIPESAEAITLKALAKNPANRYASAEDLAADLRRFRAGQPVLAEAILPAEDPTSAVAATTGATRAVPRVEGTRVVSQVSDDGWYDDEPAPRNSAFIPVLLGLLAVLAVLLVLFARNLGVGDGNNGEIEVPSVIGQTEAQAVDQLEELGLDVDIVYETDEERPDGVVFAQNPEGGTNVEKGAEVTITVSSGQPLVKVPNLVGMTEAEADEELRSLGLVADFDREDADGRPEGEVLSQEPEPGEEVRRGSVVIVVVASGPNEVEVPEVSGMPENQAANELGRAGFETASVGEASDTVEAGRVIRTSPGGGELAEEGSLVQLVVSTGPATSTVPNVVGLAPGLAAGQLEDAGFEVSEDTQSVADPGQDGLVIDQSPNAGESATLGSTVTIVVGVFEGSSTTAP